MRVTENGDGTYDVRGLTGDEAAMLGALADFPHWADQPKEIAEFCEALHTDMCGTSLTRLMRADVHGMTDNTTV